MNKKWEYYKNDYKKIKKISLDYKISELLTTVMLNRGIEEDNIEKFLNPKRNDFYDAFLMPDMEKATMRIIKAINRKEKVLIYGDYDVDGITSITVLKQFLDERGLKTGFYIPNRLKEGYGLNKNALEKIKAEGYTLIITVDCGISANDEVDYLNAFGLEIIITDHHEQLEKLPKALAIVDAKRKESKYPFKNLAGVGTVFKLIQALSAKLQLDNKEFLKYLDIVSIGTISDIVPLIDENRIITKLGLNLLEQTKNIGLKALINSLNLKKIDSYSVAFGIAPRINACGRLGYEQEALKLFLSKDINESKEIVKKLHEYNIERQEIEKNIYKEALIKTEKEKDSNVIMLESNNWHQGVIGIVASKLIEKLAKPVILICFDNDIGKGSGRSISCFDLHNALSENKEYLEGYGRTCFSCWVIN